jgi:phage tail-like protein
MTRPEEPTAVLLGGRHGWPTVRRANVAVGARSGIRLAADPAGPLDPSSPDESLGGLTLPRWLTVAPDGAVILLDGAVLLAFDHEEDWFEVVPGIGGRGAGARRFERATALAATARSLYVSDTGNRRVQVFARPGLALRAVWGPWDASGRPVAPDDTSAWEPVDVATRANDAYVLDRGYARVHRHRAGTDMPEVLVDEPRAAGRWTRIAVDRDGRVHLFDPARRAFDVFDATGRPEARPADPGDVRDSFDAPPIRVDSRGRFCLPQGLLPECGRRPPDTPPSPERPLALCPPGPVFDRHGRPAAVGEAEPAGPRSYVIAGRWIGGPRAAGGHAGPFDSEIERCQWHRIELELELPAGTAFVIRTYADDRLRAPAEIAALPDELWSPGIAATGRIARPGEDVVEWHDDFLVQSREGRYLWLRLDLRSDGYATPAVRAARVHYPRESYLEYLPAVYRSDDESRWFLERFLSLAQTEWDELEACVGRLAAYFDPKAVPAGPFLDALAAWLGLPLEGAWSGDERRRLLEAAPALYPRRGTVAAVREHLRISLENEVGTELPDDALPQVVEGYRERAHLMVSLDEHGRLGGGAPLWSLAKVGRLRPDVFSRAARFHRRPATRPLPRVRAQVPRLRACGLGADTRAGTHCAAGARRREACARGIRLVSRRAASSRWRSVHRRAGHGDRPGSLRVPRLPPRLRRGAEPATPPPARLRHRAGPTSLRAPSAAGRPQRPRGNDDHLDVMEKEAPVERERCEHRCMADCGAIVVERNLYFTGKFLTPRDFAGEQEYLVGRHRLHNRLLHGWGIVCGLRVVEHPNPECRDEWLVVRSGIAIDCCGRELVLLRDLPFHLPFTPEDESPREEPRPEHPTDEERPDQYPEGEKTDEDAAEQAPPEYESPEQQPPDDSDNSQAYLLCARYAEEEIELVPALYHESCDPTRTHANRVRECVRIELRRLDEVDPGCWKKRTGEPGVVRDDCDDGPPGRGGSCLEADCPCGSCVPLALVWFDPDRPDRGFGVDTSGRRQLPAPPEYLTHVAWISWPHGGEMTLRDLADAGDRLVVGFDRRLLEDASEATGINEHTLQVTYGSAQEDLEFLPFESPPYADGDRAVFPIDPAYLDPGGRRSIAGSVVYVTLKCGFVLDCHENPVDGDYLRAVLPSGDGVPGGTFESWFRVVAGDGSGREA